MNIDKDHIGKPPNVAIIINERLIAANDNLSAESVISADGRAYNDTKMTDNREKLEADVYNGFSGVALSEQMRDVLRSRVHVWLDRQAAITERELCDMLKDVKARLKRENDELKARNHELESGFERMDALLTQKQRVIDIQRESFRKLEYEITVLKKKGAM